jgi:alginate O-acetyltransferase complex protein AlgI
MLFTSFQFFVFFPIVCFLYFTLPPRWRSAMLLAASYVFYMAWEPAYSLLLLFKTLLSYFTALRMDAADTPRARKIWLQVSLTGYLGLLFFFKYFNLFSWSSEVALSWIGIHVKMPHSSFLLPVGISFFTFQALSYSIDVYRRVRPAEHDLLIHALYVSFFPQLVAGPIERSTTLLPQLFHTFPFEYRRVVFGLQLMAWGYFKKLVIADRLAVYVDHVYADPHQYGGNILALATVFFAYQIYCDFSGYTDIAIGASQVLGYRLMENFRQPYFSATIQGFWRRWHISLSTWFRDYLYIPLGGNRVSRLRQHLNLFIVFLLSGLWHGANWTYVVWGALHGCFLVFGNITREWRVAFARSIGLTSVPVLRRALQIACTFVLVDLAWIFFRAGTIGDAWYVLTHLHRGWESGADIYLGLGSYEFWLGIVAVGVMETVHVFQRRMRMREAIAELPTWERWILYYGVVMAVLLFGKSGGGKFIYFQF